jgi:hypothetical protein
LCLKSVKAGDCEIHEVFEISALRELKCCKTEVIFAILGTHTKCRQVYNVLYFIIRDKIPLAITTDHAIT